jgi:hypothetical protein
MPETMIVKTASTKDGSSRIVMVDLQGFGGKMLSLCCCVKTLYGKHLKKNFIPSEKPKKKPPNGRGFLV